MRGAAVAPIPDDGGVLLVRPGAARQTQNRFPRRLIGRRGFLDHDPGIFHGGNDYPWVSVQVLGLLAVSIVVWVLFLKAEAGAEEPILDLQVLKNRTFITLASAGLLSSFGLVGMVFYYPLLMQGVQGVSATSTDRS